ncbi:MAG: hypothetical protein MR979_05665 [Mollicutes bacterium]|nr:hypothetical protein [Mollicutes bacterium]
MDYSINEILSASIALVGILFCWFSFFFNLFVRKYRKNKLFYMIVLFIFGFYMCGFGKYYNPETRLPYQDGSNWLQFISGGIADALTLFVFQIKSDYIRSFVLTKNGGDLYFIIIYVIYSLSCVVLVAMSTITLFIKNFIPRAKNLISGPDVIIFTDENNPLSLQIAKQLKKKGDNVIVILDKTSMIYQNASEFKSAFEKANIDFRLASLSEKYLSTFINRRLLRKGRKITILSLYSKEEDNIHLGILALNRIRRCFNKEYIQYSKEIETCLKDSKPFDIDKIQKMAAPLEKAKFNEHLNVVLLKHTGEFEKSYRFGTRSFGVIRTLSFDDVIAEKFVLDYPLYHFYKENEEWINNIKNYKKVPSIKVHLISNQKAIVNLFEKMATSYQLFDDVIPSFEFVSNIGEEPFVDESISNYIHLFNISNTQINIHDRSSVMEYGKRIAKENDDNIHLFVVHVDNGDENDEILSLLYEMIYLKYERNNTYYFAFQLTSKGKVNLYDGKNKETYPLDTKRKHCYTYGHLEDFLNRAFEKNEILSFIGMSLNLTYSISTSYSLSNRDSLSINEEENQRGKIEWILMKPEEKEKNINPIYTYPTKMYLLGYRLSFVQHDDLHYASIEITRLDNKQKISLDEFSSSVASLRYKDEQEDLLPIQKTLFSIEHLRYVVFDVLYLKTEALDFTSFVSNIVSKKKDGSYNLVNKNKTSNVFIIKTEELWNLPDKTFTYLNENKGQTGCLLLDSLNEKEYETAMKIIHSSLLKKVYQTDINGITELGYILDNANKLVKRD